MSIANVTAGAGITEAWGDSVADTVNRLGMKTYGTRTTGASGITTETGILTAPTFTAAAGVLYRIHAFALVSSTVDADRAALRIVRNSVTQLTAAIMPLRAAGGGRDTAIHAVWIGELTGSTSIAATLARVSGTGSLFLAASSTEPTLIVVEGIGEA